MQEDMKKNYCLTSIGQELERMHTLLLHLYRPHSTTESTHVSHKQENLGGNCCLRSIGKELERISSATEEIEDAHLKDEKKRMDYSFYGSSPSPLPSVASSREGPEGEVATTFTPSAAAEVDDCRVNDELFEEYFGSYLTQGSTTKRHLSLHVPAYNARRSYSQTLVWQKKVIIINYYAAHNLNVINFIIMIL